MFLLRLIDKCNNYTISSLFVTHSFRDPEAISLSSPLPHTPRCRPRTARRDDTGEAGKEGSRAAPVRRRARHWGARPSLRPHGRSTSPRRESARAPSARDAETAYHRSPEEDRTTRGFRRSIHGVAGGMTARTCHTEVPRACGATKCDTQKNASQTAPPSPPPPPPRSGSSRRANAKT